MVIATSSYAQAGILDSSFHDDGAAFFHFAGSSAVASSVAVLPNEKILVAGTVVTGPGADSDILLLRYNTDGSLDTSFGNNGMTLFSWGGQHDFAKTVVMQPDGKILVAGWTVSDGRAYGILCRFSEYGILDKTFDEDGVVYNGSELTEKPFMDLFLTDDAKILWCMITKAHDSSIMQFLLSGKIDTSFGDAGAADLELPWSTYKHGTWGLLPEGRIAAIIGYLLYSDHLGDPPIIYVKFLRYSKDGKTLEINQILENYEPLLNDALAWEEGVIIGGYAVSKTDYDGILENDFVFKGKQKAIPGLTNSMVAQIDGKLVVVGQKETILDTSIFVTRLNTDGEVDKNFGRYGHVLLNFSPNDDIAYATAIDADDRILVAGRSGDSLVVARVFGRKYTGPPNPGVDSIFFGFRPNPVGSVLTADYGLPTDGNISIELLDLFGRQVQSFYSEANRQAGHYAEPLHILGTLPNGTYLLRVRSGEFHAVQKLIVIR